jgi:hypothetical protein
MGMDESELVHVEPSFLVKAFSLLGAFVAISAVATLIAFILTAVSRWYRYEYSIFGLAWGVCARLFELSVRHGIKQNIASERLTTQKRKVLGEQLTMLRITRWFVHIELAASALLLGVEIAAR